MPTYVYEMCDTGRIVEVTMTVFDMKARELADGTMNIRRADQCWDPEVKNAVVLNGKARRRMDIEIGAARHTSGYPYWSDALGVHPEQIPEARREFEKHGIQAEFNGEGQVKVEDRSHRARMIRACGMYDRSAGYGDPAPVNG